MGFLGLAAIVMALIRDRKCWKPMLIGVGLAVVTAVIVVLPFSVNQGNRHDRHPIAADCEIRHQHQQQAQHAVNLAPARTRR